MIIQLLFGQRIGHQIAIAGPNFGHTYLAHDEQINPLNFRIRSLSMGLRQVFLYSSSHGNVMMILIVNASHVASRAYFLTVCKQHLHRSTVNY